MKHPTRVRAASILVAAAALLASLAAVPAHAAAPPQLKLFATKTDVTIYRRTLRPVPLDPGLYLESLGAPFELHLARPDYDTPISLTQWVNGSEYQTVPDDMYTIYGGFTNFYHVKVKHRGTVWSDQQVDFCPASYDTQRVDDSGPPNPTYPFYGCYASPFTLGAVWGIDQGWAVNALNPYGYYGYGSFTYISGHDGTYYVHVQVDPAFQALFGISPTDGTVDITVHLVTKKHHCPYPCYGRDGKSSATDPYGRQPKRSITRPLDSVPIDLNPDPSTLPDMIATPDWSIRTYNRRHQDYIGFADTEWDRGPSPLWVEGFRQTDTETMNAYQYFTDSSGTIVGRAPVGTFEFDTRPGHDHWHMAQFVQYSILDESMTQVVLSHKQSFCIAPTDPMDLTVPNAVWNPYSLGFYSNCGFGESALWTREVLPVGWGDTYYQGVAGQAFNITHLPNGTYWVQAQVNPTGALYEADTSNDTEIRQIVLTGKPGNRRVQVEPWHSITV